MLSSFLHVLLDILIQNSHGLLQEEIIHSVYSMVVYNFEAYFNQFIPHYLMNITGITDHQRMQLHANYKRHQVTFSLLLIKIISKQYNRKQRKKYKTKKT